MAPSYNQTFPILVLGAGPGGLALGAALQQRGVPFLIIEQGPEVGHSWRRMPSRLKLLSPWKANWIRPGDASRFTAHHETTREEFACYLRDFAAERRLPVRTNVQVKAVRCDAKEGFIVQTSVSELRAHCVVNATGCFSAPWTPEIPGANASPLLRLHTADFGDAESLRRRIQRDERPVLIVGKRLSAGQAMIELVEAGFQVALSCRGPVEFGPGPLVWWWFFRLHPWLEARELRRRGAQARGFTPKMPGGKARQLVERGLVQIFPPIERFNDSSVVFSDGRSLEPSGVIFATGFRRALRHLAPLGLRLNTETGSPELTGFESSEASGLFFLGLDGQRNFQSRFIRGIRQDAPLLAAKLAQRLAEPVNRSAGLPTRREPGDARSRSSTHHMTSLRRIQYYASVPRTWLQLTLHNSWGILNVLDIIWLRPMRGGLIDESHPFCTGVDPATGKSIWHSNVIFRTPPRVTWAEGHRAPDSDDEIFTKVGGHLCHQVGMAASSADHPGGRPAPMPPGILYLHGGVHYNGGWLLFNDFAEAIEHFSDRRFAAEFRRFVREQRREPLTLFRDRDYDRDEFARFVCFMRTTFPWFSNSNGPKKFVLWGNPSPYPAVNTITGNWIRDCRLLQSELGRRAAPRPPIPAGQYFQDGPWQGERSTTLWPENLLAWATERRIHLRGEQENLYFVDKRKLKAGLRFGPEPIPSPWRRLARKLGF